MENMVNNNYQETKKTSGSKTVYSFLHHNSKKHYILLCCLKIVVFPALIIGLPVNVQQYSQLLAQAPPPSVEVSSFPMYQDKALPKLNKRQIHVSGRVFWDTNQDENDKKEQGISGVLVSDGEHVTITNDKGNYNLNLEFEEDIRYIFITRPRGTKLTTPWSFSIPLEENKTKYEINFGLMKYPLSDQEDFTFLASSDAHLSQYSELVKLKKEFKQISSMSGNPGFLTMTGDLTQHGSGWELDMYKNACTYSCLTIYNVFGGHDALSREKQGIKNIFNYELKISPAWFSWDYGPVHFIVAVSEISYLSEKQRERQMRWLDADLAVLPPGKPIILNMHTTAMNGQIRKWKEKYNIIALLYGHYHFNTVTGTEEIPYIVTGPLRNRDWGAFTTVFRVLKYSKGKLFSEIRIGGQYNRLEIVSPQGKMPADIIPVQVLAYNTSSRVKNIYCEIRCDGMNNVVPLKQNGDWTWSGVWKLSKQTVDSNICLISATAVDDQGKMWSSQKQFTLTNETPPVPHPGKFWPSVFGPDGTQRVTTDQPNLPMNLLWTIQTGGRNTVSSPIVYRDKVYIGVDNSEIGYRETGILCVDAFTGKRIWKQKTPASVVSTPLAEKGFIYAVDTHGNCYKFDAETGKIIWHRNVSKGIITSGHIMIGSPLVMYENELYVPGGYIYGHITVIDANSGEIVRYINGRNYFQSFPVMIKKQLWLPGKGGRLEVFDSSTGQSLKKVGLSAGGKTSVGIYYDGHFFINSQNAYCLDIGNYKVVWKNPTPSQSNGISLPVAGKDIVYYHGGADFYAFDINTGRLIWKVPFIYDIEEAKVNQRQIYGGQSSPLLAGNLVFVGADDGGIYALDAETGRTLWYYDLVLPIKSSPVVSGNMLFINDFDGNLYAFTGKKLTGSEK